MAEIKIKVFSCLCELEQFQINGINADYEDFGDKYDRNPYIAEPYGCGDMQFIPHTPTDEILHKYKITADEYEDICHKLNCLSFGNCGWCI